MLKKTLIAAAAVSLMAFGATDAFAGKGGGGGKWQKNWEKWQDQLDETGSEDDKAGWQAQMQKWQQDGDKDKTTNA